MKYVEHLQSKGLNAERTPAWDRRVQLERWILGISFLCFLILTVFTLLLDQLMH
jgi:hypothetical protein